MLVYGKMINNTQLVFIDEFKLTQKYCTYYIYEIIN